MKIFVDVHGCEQRKLDAQRVIDYVQANGATLAADPSACDVAVIVTCAVDHGMEDASAAAVHELAVRLPSTSRLVVGGCLPSISPGRLAGVRVHATFSPRTLESLDRVFHDSTWARPMAQIPDVNRSGFDDRGQQPAHPKYRAPAREQYEAAKRGFKIRIDQGCLSSCSFCAIRSATGVLESKAPEAILAEFRIGLAAGERTFLLAGGDTGAYGLDLGTDLPTLLKTLCVEGGDYEVFIHDLNVQYFIRSYLAFLDVLGDPQLGGKRVRAINFPIQSGSDRILRLMRRRYCVADVIKYLTMLRYRAPTLAIGTHIIVGFPGETEDDFQQTLALIDAVGFDFVACFPYAEHAQTAAARLPGKIDALVARERLELVYARFREQTLPQRAARRLPVVRGEG